MEDWWRSKAGDGFTIMAPVQPRGLRDFVDLVVPELQRRGIFRKEYEATTLRGHLGLPEAPSQWRQEQVTGSAARHDGSGFSPAARWAAISPVGAIRTRSRRPACNCHAWVEMAQIAERGGLDMMFLADGNGVRQMDKPALFAANSPSDRPRCSSR